MAGTVAQTFAAVSNRSNIASLTFAWTASITGTLTTVTSTWDIDGYVILGVVNPGTVKPSTNFAIACTDSDGMDIFANAITTLSSIATAQFLTKVGTTELPQGRFVDGKVNFAISSNSNPGATGTFKLIIDRR